MDHEQSRRFEHSPLESHAANGMPSDAHAYHEPMNVLEYNLRKKLKFQPKSNIAGKYLEEFLGLTTNPDGFAQQAFKVPAEFNAFSRLGQYAG